MALGGIANTHGVHCALGLDLPRRTRRRIRKPYPQNLALLAPEPADFAGLEKQAERERSVPATSPELSLYSVEFADGNGRITRREAIKLPGASRSTLSNTSEISSSRVI
jgi:hypothetical protein